MISPELQTFFESGVSVLVGTRDRDLIPDCVRGMGARVEAGGTEITVFVPASTGAQTAANVAATGRIAVCFGRPRDHRTIQVKGQVLSIAAADERDRQRIERYREEFAEEQAWIGIPVAVVRRIAHWPCHAVRLRCEAIFVQTPGPGAGDPLAAASDRNGS